MGAVPARPSAWLLGGVLLAALGLSACAGPPNPGEYGTFRYVGNVRGDPPLNVIPPTSDRQGNVYVLYGAPTLLEAALFIGHAGGGWSGGCGIIGGSNFGVHGWVGHAESRAWYWAGDALVAASGNGDCRRVLQNDPASGALLRFRAVVPWVRDTPSRTTTVAWVQAYSDPAPFRVVVDLNTQFYAQSQPFEPPGASDVTVLGVGGDSQQYQGVALVRYTINGQTRTEAHFVDKDANLLARASLPSFSNVPEYGVQGYLQANDSGLYAGLDSDGQLMLLDQSGGRLVSVGGMKPVGVQRWEGQLWLVGTSGSQPVIRPIDNSGNLGGIERWDASLTAQAGLAGNIQVLDDRSLPSRIATWNHPVSAMGPLGFPFVHPHRLDHYADGTTGWVIAGPHFSAGGEDRTAIAFVPVGVAYP